METVSDLLQCILNLIYSDFVFQLFNSVFFQLIRTLIQSVLDLTNDIVFDRLLAFTQITHDFFMRPIDHLRKHLNVILTFF